MSRQSSLASASLKNKSWKEPSSKTSTIKLESLNVNYDDIGYNVRYPTGIYTAIRDLTCVWSTLLVTGAKHLLCGTDQYFTRTAYTSKLSQAGQTKVFHSTIMKKGKRVKTVEEWLNVCIFNRQEIVTWVIRVSELYNHQWSNSPVALGGHILARVCSEVQIKSTHY